MTENRDEPTAGDSMASRRRFLGTAAVGALAGVAGCIGGTRTGSATSTQSDGAISQGPAIGLETVSDGFSEPIDFAVPPDDDRRFVLEREGQVYALSANGQRGEPFLDISDRMAEITGERGLLGIAFHPEFDANGKFYLRYSAPLSGDAPDGFSHTAVLSEFRASDDGSTGRPDSERVLLEVPEPQDNHNAGAVTFGPDGYLYVPFGDGGAAHDVGSGHVSDWYDANDGGNGQDVTENFLGSILRIDVDSREDGKPYAIPEDNPLVGREGLSEQYAWGFRNPWRMGFSGGELYVADVGQNRYEEVDRVVKGGNYGWNVKEGTHCFSASDPAGSPDGCPDSTPGGVRGGEPLRDPVIEYPHTRGGESIGVSVIGGYIYEGTIDALRGKYVFGDYIGDGTGGVLFAATPTEEGLWSIERLQVEGVGGPGVGGSLIAIGRDNAGELYALTTDSERSGAVHRLVSTGGSESGGASNTTNTTSATATSTATTETDSEPTRQTTGTDTTAMTGETGTARRGTPVDRPTQTESVSRTSGDTTQNSETSSSEGPGFGALAALAGLAGIAARVLGGEE